MLESYLFVLLVKLGLGFGCLSFLVFWGKEVVFFFDVVYDLINFECLLVVFYCLYCEVGVVNLSG